MKEIKHFAARVGCGGIATSHSRADSGYEVVADSNFTLTRHGLKLAVGSLLLAGCLALLLVVGRIPVLAEWTSDPVFFKRCLVFHVDLSIVVWFLSFSAALFALLPGDSWSNGAFRAGFVVAVVGVIAMAAGAVIRGGQPVLSNYVPMIAHPVFVAGIVLFFLGLLFCFLNGRLFASATLPKYGGNPMLVTEEAAAGLKTTALAYIVAITTFIGSWRATPRFLDSKTYYELVFWGGGHVLQVANVAAMLTVWLLLLGSLLQRPVLSSRVAWVLFGTLLAPHLTAPLLTVNGTVSSLYRLGFTRLMQFGIAPVVVVFLGLCLHQLWHAWRIGVIGKADLRDPRFIGFSASAALTITGFLLGSAIRSSTTIIPAHYHASIGAVTIAFMAVTYLLLKPLGLPLAGLRWQRLIPWQLSLFGGGQVIFALGFALGGFHGLSRKAYGAEQHLRSPGELVGIVVMGMGGLIAVAGGLLFLLLTARAGWPRTAVIVSRPKLKPLAVSSA